MKKSIYPLVGAVITLLFLFFATPLYEAFFYDSEFSNAMYDNHIYLFVSLITAATAWVVAAVFYYVVDSVSFSRWYHWLIMLGVAVVVAAGGGYLCADRIFASLDYAFHGPLLSFSLVNALVEAVLFVVASFSMRWWSVNCRHTPLPE